MEKLTLPESRIAALEAGFGVTFGGKPERFFSAPGRTELGGNHTDHQQGRVLAAAVSLDMQAAARANGTQTIQVLSQGYPILGDPQYATPQSREFSQKHGLYTQLLCAKQLEFVHPVTGQKLCLQSNLNPDF